MQRKSAAIARRRGSLSATMRVTTLLALLALAGLWERAFSLWPDLPDRVPVHFGLDGTPDRYADRSAGVWFVLPVLGTVLWSLFALGLPALVRRLARTNSIWLNIPRRDAFRSLPTDARLRVVADLAGLLRLIGAELVVLFAIILHGTAKVAGGAWTALPDAVMLGGVIVIPVTALWSIPRARVLIARELAARPAGADADPQAGGSKVNGSGNR